MTDSPRPQAAAKPSALSTWLVPAVRAPENARMPGLGKMLLLAVELVLIWYVIDQFQIASQKFVALTKLAFYGFFVHAFLPVRWRLPFFSVLSMYGIVLVLGSFASPALIGLGLGLALIAMLPIRVLWRSLILLGVGTGLGLMRADVFSAPWSGAIWPILGSMFMFRMIIFLYDQSHGEKPGSVWETISYFFLLPNVCFPLFPTVDFKTYRRTYYGEEAWQCYQTGVRWMARGLVHYLLYRFLYYYGVLAPTEVASAADLARYMVSNIALYLRVSGVFHLCIGMLRLYGFALPETHFLYYLSASVNDFWRRANIYWKDFMLKVFYLPMFFRLRKQGNTTAFIVSTAYVVLVTWALHSYQYFWIGNTFPIHWQDGVFWAALGLMMVWNTLAESRTSKARGRHARAKQTWDIKRGLSEGSKVLGTFVFMCTIWSLWTCESFGGWLDMLAMRGTGSAADLSGTAALVCLPVFAFVFLVEAAGGKDDDPERSPLRSFGMTSLGLATLLAFGTPQVYERFGDEGSKVVQSIKVTKLNRLDASNLQKGYYEGLLDVGGFNLELAGILNAKPENWLELHETPAMRPTTDFLLTELRPDLELEYKGAPMRINEFGLRDRDYTLAKPANTHRTAVIGASYIMGSGVENDQTFENLVEDRMNAEWSDDGRAFELLNLGVGGYSPLQRLFAFEHKGLPFEPDVALYIAHENEVFRIYRHLSAARDRGVESPWPELTAILDEAGVTKGMAKDVFDRKLEPYVNRILAFAFQRIAEVCRENDVVPLFCFLPTLEMYGEPADIEWMLDIARDAGFEVITLFGVYDDHDIFDIRIADWDYHPNAEGHEIIAARLFEELAKRRDLFE